jgi:hypothetical protein
MNLLEKLKGDRRPEGSLAAKPKALLGCSNSGCVVAISIVTKMSSNESK